MKFVESKMRNLQLGLECVYAFEQEQCLSTYLHAYNVYKYIYYSLESLDHQFSR